MARRTAEFMPEIMNRQGHGISRHVRRTSKPARERNRARFLRQNASRVIRLRHLTAAWLLVLLTSVPCFAGPKTDVIELLNGDRITCEIQKLERGKLTVKTDGLGTISIEWNDVARITSPSNFVVELETGLRYFGTLVAGDARTVNVGTTAGVDKLDLGTVVRINPMGRSFWRRLDGSISAGFNFTQANVETQWTFSSKLTYRGPKWVSTLTGDSLLTDREDAARQTRNNISLLSQRLLGPRWAAVGFSQLQQNEELSLNLRAVFGGGPLRAVVQTNQTLLNLMGGVAYTTEQYAGADDVSVLEAVAGADWDWFTYDGRSTNMGLTALTFYALTGDARFRLELNTSFKSDIISDLYWSINMFESFNSLPPTGQKKNDFGISAAIGWTF